MNILPGVIAQYQTKIITDSRKAAVALAQAQGGAVFDLSDLSSLWQDRDATVPVTAAGQPVARIDDVTGNGNYARSGGNDTRPTLKTDGKRYWIEFDGKDDYMLAPRVASSDGYVLSHASQYYGGKQTYRYSIVVDQFRNPGYMPQVTESKYVAAIGNLIVDLDQSTLNDEVTLSAARHGTTATVWKNGSELGSDDNAGSSQSPNSPIAFAVYTPDSITGSVETQSRSATRIFALAMTSRVSSAGADADRKVLEAFTRSRIATS